LATSKYSFNVTREWMGISKFTNGHFQDYSVNLSNTFCIPVGRFIQIFFAKSASFKTVFRNKSLTKSLSSLSLYNFGTLKLSFSPDLMAFNCLMMCVFTTGIIYPSQFVVL
jgi:hypothetical protein